MEHGYTANFYCHFIETVAVPIWLYLPPAIAQHRELAGLRSNLDATVQNLDLLPTILDCIGALDAGPAAALREPMLGQSLFRPVPPDRTVWITNTDEIMPSVIGLSSITGNQHYMIRTSNTPAKEDVYDLATDAAEQHNRWAELTDSQRDAFRRSFLRFPVAARMIQAACPDFKPGLLPSPTRCKNPE